MASVRNTYIDSEYGQIHARVHGAGAPVVMFHWTPGSGAMLAHIGEAMAARGYEVWALDMLGFGRSARPPTPGWTQSRHGAAMADALTGAGLENAVLCGGHMGAEVALECAIARPQLAKKLVLDGVATDWDPATRDDMINAGGYKAPDYDKDGAPISWAWKQTLWIWNAWRPDMEATPETGPLYHQAMIDLMETNFDIAPMAEAFGAYEAKARLPLAPCPVLALTADSDTLRGHFPSTVKALGAPKAHVFDGAHPAHAPDRGEAYAEVLDAFIQDRPFDWLGPEDDLAPKGEAKSYS